MSRYDFPGQAAAARAYDNASPDERDDSDAQERAIQQWARNLVLRDEVDELAQEIYDAGGMILAAVEVYRAKTGRVPSYHETSFLRRLRELISEVENAR